MIELLQLIFVLFLLLIIFVLLCFSNWIRRHKKYSNLPIRRNNITLNKLMRFYISIFIDICTFIEHKKLLIIFC